MKISVLGAGAFGTAIAITIARGGQNVTLWGRDKNCISQIKKTKVNEFYLPDVPVPNELNITDNLKEALSSDIICLTVPMQQLTALLSLFDVEMANRRLVACCKGIDLETNEGPTSIVKNFFPNSIVAVLTGPSFALDIAKGLPTALTIGCKNSDEGKRLQASLSTKTLRIYRTTDVVGAELGGALKNVVAIACGVAIGAGYGDSARAALMTRGFVEMRKFAVSLGAQEITLSGLSGFGDLSLTCMSKSSRNFSYGFALGAGENFDQTITVEGISTAKAALKHPKLKVEDIPIIRLVDQLVNGDVKPEEAMQELMTRPNREE